MDIKKRKQERFLPLIKSYLKAKKEKMLNDNPHIIRHLVFLCRNIDNEKIIKSFIKALKKRVYPFAIFVIKNFTNNIKG
jgi:hypothetical protein